MKALAVAHGKKAKCEEEKEAKGGVEIKGCHICFLLLQSHIYSNGIEIEIFFTYFYFLHCNCTTLPHFTMFSYKTYDNSQLDSKFYCNSEAIRCIFLSNTKYVVRQWDITVPPLSPFSVREAFDSFHSLGRAYDLRIQRTRAVIKENAGNLRSDYSQLQSHVFKLSLFHDVKHTHTHTHTHTHRVLLLLSLSLSLRLYRAFSLFFELPLLFCKKVKKICHTLETCANGLKTDFFPFGQTFQFKRFLMYGKRTFYFTF